MEENKKQTKEENTKKQLDDSTDIENLKKQMQEYAEKIGIKLNPDLERLNEVLKGLLAKKEKNNEIYCPCRILSNNKEKDKEIICPCVFHRGEIELQGHCLCNLFFR